MVFVTKNKLIWIFIILMFLLLTGFSVWGQGGGKQVRKIALLIVDETKTFQYSMKIEFLARTVKKIQIFDLSAEIVDVKSSYDIPLNKNTTDQQYEIILLFPRGLDDESVQEVWILSSAINHKMDPLVKEGIQTLSSMIEKIFQMKAIDVSEDFVPALLAGALAQNGWISL